MDVSARFLTRKKNINKLQFLSVSPPLLSVLSPSLSFPVLSHTKKKHEPSSTAAAAAALSAQAAQVSIERRTRDFWRPLSLVAPAPQVRVS